MKEGLGLKAWEIREIRHAMRGIPVMMMFVVAPAGAAIGLHWVALAYAAGAALAWAALRTDGAGGFRHRLRRVVAWICERELRLIPAVAVPLAASQVFYEFAIAPWEVLVAGLWDPEMTKAEVADALVEALRQVRAEAEPWVLLVGVSGICLRIVVGPRGLAAAGRDWRAAGRSPVAGAVRAGVAAGLAGVSCPGAGAPAASAEGRGMKRPVEIGLLLRTAPPGCAEGTVAVELKRWCELFPATFGVLEDGS